MKKIIFLLLILIPASLLAVNLSLEKTLVSSQLAISQTGRFSVFWPSPLVLDGKKSLTLSNFLAYKSPENGDFLAMGEIPGNETLKTVCDNPLFLKRENIENAPFSGKSIPFYFMNNKYKGCLINLDKKISVVIAELPNPFVSQTGETISHVGIVSSPEKIKEVKNQISFRISAKDYFVSLLQISQTFSPFSEKINWNLVRSQGMTLIGREKASCWAVVAAARFLIPALNKHDFHSFITLNRSEASSCPPAPHPESEEIKKWLSIPESTRNSIIHYASSFHGKRLAHGISYLYIPSMDVFDPLEINKKITEGRKMLSQSGIETASGLIIDLRFNLGGSLVPMLLTISGNLPAAPLFGLGKSLPVSITQDRNTLLINSNYESVYGKYSGKSPAIVRILPVAILTNWMTASSANIVSQVLRDHLSNVRVFGEMTSPTTSINTTFFLMDGNTLNLMVDRVYNKNGHIVPLRLPVDEEIKNQPAQTVFDEDRDLTLLSAIKWLEIAGKAPAPGEGYRLRSS